MAFQPVPDTVEAVCHYVSDGAPCANVLHFVKPGGYIQSALDNLAGRIVTVLDDHFYSLLPPTQSIVAVTVKGLAEENDLTASASSAHGIGARESTQMPNNVSLCLTVRTGVTGRSARGRIYMIPPCIADVVAPNQVTTTYRDAVTNLWGLVASAANGAGFSFVVVSRFTGKAKRPFGVIFPVTDIIARNTRLDSQRGRMPLPT